MKIEKVPNLGIGIKGDGRIISSQSVEANLLYEILQELKRIKRLLQARSPSSVNGEEKR
jgi:hypothetical protein